MKKMFFILIFLIFIMLSYTFAYSEEFNLMIDVMGIPKENINHKPLNEEIFNAYSLFVYGSPIENYKGQRFKIVDEGKWTQNGGIWNNSGVRGEYWILGENDKGYEVHNHKFPVDIEPPTPPTKWRYAVIKDALDSWQDQSKYMYEEQKDYMQNTKLMRNNIAYDITANDIGLDRIRLENYATWKTKGTLYTQRYDMQNNLWSANFMVPEMAADSEIEGYAEFPNGTKYYLKDEEELVIPINFGAKVINLSEFAKQEHVKQIKSELYINDELISSIENTGVLEINNSAFYTLQKDNTDMIILNVKIKAILLTKFTTDGALTDIKEYTLIVCFNEEEDTETEKIIYNSVDDDIYSKNEFSIPPYIDNIKVTVISRGQEISLSKGRLTGNDFVCAGQTIKIYADVVNGPANVTLEFEGDKSITRFDDTTKKFEYYDPLRNGLPIYLGSLDAYNKMYSSIVKLDEDEYIEDNLIRYETTYIVPYETRQTLNSWSTLRATSKDAFDVDEKKIFTRITSPYQLVIKAKNAKGADTSRYNLDVFERWDTLYNRDISPYLYRDNESYYGR